MLNAASASVAAEVGLDLRLLLQTSPIQTFRSALLMVPLVQPPQPFLSNQPPVPLFATSLLRVTRHGRVVDLYAPAPPPLPLSPPSEPSYVGSAALTRLRSLASMHCDPDTPAFPAEAARLLQQTLCVPPDSLSRSLRFNHAALDCFLRVTYGFDCRLSVPTATPLTAYGPHVAPIFSQEMWLADSPASITSQRWRPVLQHWAVSDGPMVVPPLLDGAGRPLSTIIGVSRADNSSLFRAAAQALAATASAHAVRGLLLFEDSPHRRSVSQAWPDLPT